MYTNCPSKYVVALLLMHNIVLQLTQYDTAALLHASDFTDVLKVPLLRCFS
jgi:hypothetical protein